MFNEPYTYERDPEPEPCEGCGHEPERCQCEPVAFVVTFAMRDGSRWPVGWDAVCEVTDDDVESARESAERVAERHSRWRAVAVKAVWTEAELENERAGAERVEDWMSD
jgi:hypothetical protein